MTTTHANEFEPAFVASPRRDGDRAFRAALRHSRLVRILRVGIPASIVVGALSTYIVITILNPFGHLAKLPIGADGLVISGTKIMMQQPRVKGFTKDKRPYSMTARTAAQDVTKPDILELQDIRATLETDGRGEVEIVARDGLYDGKADRLTLRNSVVVTTTEVQVALDEAVVQIKAGHVVSEQPVEVRFLQGKLNANRLEVQESGAVVRFDRGVTMVIEDTDAIIRTTADNR